METKIDSFINQLLKETFMEALKEFHSSDQSPYYSQKDDKQKVYTRNEVAALLNKSPNTVTKYIRQGLHASCINNVYYINEKSLQKFLSSKNLK